jgi:hypothetical protein
MTLGLAHSLSRYKLKFSPDKVDTMIVQAIGESMPPRPALYALCVRALPRLPWKHGGGHNAAALPRAHASVVGRLGQGAEHVHHACARVVRLALP